MSEFGYSGDPGSGQFFKVNASEGRLVLFRAKSTSTYNKTIEGNKVLTCLPVDVVVLDGPEPGRVYKDSEVAQNKVRRIVIAQAEQGKMTLGRIARLGTGPQDPWTLNPPNESDAATATAWLSNVGWDATPPPPPAPVQQPAAPPAPAAPQWSPAPAASAAPAQQQPAQSAAQAPQWQAPAPAAPAQQQPPF